MTIDDLKELVADLHPTLKMEMERLQQSKQPKQMPVYATEKDHLRRLAAACLLNLTSQADVIRKYKECMNAKLDLEHRQQIRAVWFRPIPKRTVRDFNNQFLLTYKDMKAEYDL